jgi:Uncharacterized protein conserved in bacteria (DUF2059)
MLVADLHREAARRYVDTMPISEWAHATLESSARRRPGAPPLVWPSSCVWRRLLGPALVEHFSIPELHALARFYATPEGTSIARKEVAFRTAATPMLAAEIVRHARAIAARVSSQACSRTGRRIESQLTREGQPCPCTSTTATSATAK